MTDADQLISQLTDIVRKGRAQISDIKPSDWVEQNVVMGKPFPGPFRYDKTPYTREIIDCLAPDHPARVVVVMKGAQVGFSSGVIYPGVGWMIKNAPGNTFITVGAPDLIDKAMEKLDLMIDNAGLRKYIKTQVMRNKAQKTGDTNLKKDFAGGYVSISSANNHKALRQVDLQYGFFDDFESVKSASKESGSTRKLLEQRFAAYADQMKMFLISTPERMEESNIYEAYLLGDQRKYHVPCPCCGEMIVLEWSVEVELDGQKVSAGITWKVDENNKLVKGSVGYTCQKCGDFFTENHKQQIMSEGRYLPTATPSREGFFSYHVPSLYAYVGMFDWQHYVEDYIEANPAGQQPKEELMRAFTNLCLGWPYQSASEDLKATMIMANLRNYDINTLPEKQSIKDGNGKIVLVTCAADLNGKVEDARVDYEIVAWSESGSSYSIRHGSIGTFIPLEGYKKVKEDRTHWTYEDKQQNSVWPELEAVLKETFTRDSDGTTLPIGITGLDTGHFTTYSYNFIDKVKRHIQIRALKGDKEDQYIRLDANNQRFKLGMERGDLYILKVGLFKDTIAANMQLRWDKDSGQEQPSGFMNFPEPSKGLYDYDKYFKHYEAEQRKMLPNKDGTGAASRWVKKTSNLQNHHWDVMVYNVAIKEILTAEFGKHLKLKPFVWNDLCAYLLGTREVNTEN